MELQRKRPYIFPLLGAGILLFGLIGAVGLKQHLSDRPGADASLPPLGAVPDFNLTESAGKPVHLSDMRGKVWVAEFIFTRCAGQCPLMSRQTQLLIRRMPEVKFVCFTSDPAYDTPEVLAQYAVQYGADRQRWIFLTGPKEELNKVATGLHFSSMDAPEVHSSNFVLVDGEGRVRGYYDVNDPQKMSALKVDARKLSGLVSKSKS